jgi:hypothetical protein
MYPLGHVGIGVHLIPERLRSGLRFRWLALGCVLPDLLDKPVWLAASLLHAGPLGTRLAGHTLLLCLGLLLAARLRDSRALRAVALGALTHLALDVAGELLAGMPPFWMGWLLWPAFGWRFPIESYALPAPRSETAIYLAAEAVGALLLLLRWRRLRQSRG